jgi:hypothetical protein
MTALVPETYHVHLIPLDVIGLKVFHEEKTFEASRCVIFAIIFKQVTVNVMRFIVGDLM